MFIAMYMSHSISAHILVCVPAKSGSILFYLMILYPSISFPRSFRHPPCNFLVDCQSTVWLKTTNLIRHTHTHSRKTDSSENIMWWMVLHLHLCCRYCNENLSLPLYIYICYNILIAFDSNSHRVMFTIHIIHKIGFS